MSGVWTEARIVLDLLSMRLLVWLLGHDGELLDSHLFFFDRYSDLADYHRARGRTAKADRLQAIAELHYRLAPGDDEPPAAAMAMPVPKEPVRTDAISASAVPKSDPRRPKGIDEHLLLDPR
jgi:hypothetical protein